MRKEGGDIVYVLQYLRESLLNYEEEMMPSQIMMKLNYDDYNNEIDFIEGLDEEEAEFLNELLRNEIDYAANAQDETRVKALADIYKLLF